MVVFLIFLVVIGRFRFSFRCVIVLMMVVFLGLLRIDVMKFLLILIWLKGRVCRCVSDE